MKKIITTLMMFLFFLASNAQTTRYLCEIKGIEKDLTAGLKIVFDFGNHPTYTIWGGLNGKQKLVDEKGDEIPFNSMVDAGNYLNQKGWTFLQAYPSFYGGNSVIHWIFYKDAESPEKALEGIVTKETFKKKQDKE